MYHLSCNPFRYVCIYQVYKHQYKNDDKDMDDNNVVVFRLYTMRYTYTFVVSLHSHHHHVNSVYSVCDMQRKVDKNVLLHKFIK
jgi:hypothetical protein